MFNSVLNFYSNLIDYAGLFPPAKQDMGDAWRDFCIHRDSDYKWMLANFICPAARLAELSPFFADSTTRGGTYPFSILGSRCEGAMTFKSKLNTDIQLVNNFIDSNSKDTVEINIFETHFPMSVIQQDGRLGVLELFSVADRTISTVLQDEGMIFFELPVIGVDVQPILTFIEAISNYNDSLTGDLIAHANYRCGFKLRCGGVTAKEFPTVDEIAEIIRACHQFGVPLKATAGLHHPIRHFSNDVKNTMHGFINLIGAIVLMNNNMLDLDQIRQILSDENSESFMFSDDTFSWGNIISKSDQIYKARAQSFVSYGSCSFDEPIDDLKTLGIL